MTEQPFLERWSRLKRQAALDAQSRPAEPAAAKEVAEGVGQSPADGATPAEPPASSADIDPVAAVDLARREQTPTTEPGSALPSLESLSAESDALPFLRAGVPAGLRNAALRRLWSVDPTIREFVGPADYAWDFNASDAMPGFGPLRALDDVAKMVEQIFGSSTPAVEPATEPPQLIGVPQADEAPQTTEAPEATDVSAKLPAPPLAAREADPVSETGSIAAMEAPFGTTQVTLALSSQATGRSITTAFHAPRLPRHGRAAPR